MTGYRLPGRIQHRQRTWGPIADTRNWGFIMARQAQITVERIANELVIEFAHGKTIRISPQDLLDVVTEQAVFHGLKQKLVDAAAISRNPETGRSASIEDKYQAVWTVYDRITRLGEWNAVRGEGGTGTGGLLFAALCRMYAGRKTEEELREWLSTKDKKAQAELRKNPKVAAIIEQIKAERGSDDDDGLGEDLLGELED